MLLLKLAFVLLEVLTLEVAYMFWKGGKLLFPDG